MTDTSQMIMPFAGGAIDYAEDHRSPADLQKFIGQANARAILLHKGDIALNNQGRLHRIHPSELIGHNLFEPGPIFLGLDGERPIFAASVQETTPFLPEEQFVNMRVGGGRMNPQDLAAAGRAKSLFDWHRTHRYCANCGGGSVADLGGAKRVCNHCQTEHFPRVNPVAIMLITHEDNVLLGRGHGWPDGFMSCLAGFVSPGESLEEATFREIEEEVGVRTKNHRYLFSQPWPFPSQLMMGVTCEAENTDITVNKEELEDARWFSREEVAAVFDKTAKDQTTLAFLRPPRTTIAHQLMRYWLNS